MKIVCISDTHEMHHLVELPEGDILVHAGDFTGRGNHNAIENFARWLNQTKFKHIVVIAGNHDLSFQDSMWAADLLYTYCPRINYLEDSGVTIGNLKFWGSPWQPEFHNWAFNLPRGKALADKWAKIPEDTNVLITHGPPYGIRDKVRAEFNPSSGEPLGCLDLYNKVITLPDLKLHVFGHIHDGYGQEGKYVNAAICDERYKPSNKPIVVEL